MYKIQQFTKFRLVEAESLHADWRKDEQTDMMKLIDFFRNFANAPVGVSVSHQSENQ